MLESDGMTSGPPDNPELSHLKILNFITPARRLGPHRITESRVLRLRISGGREYSADHKVHRNNNSIVAAANCY